MTKKSDKKKTARRRSSVRVSLAQSAAAALGAEAALAVFLWTPAAGKLGTMLGLTDAAGQIGRDAAEVLYFFGLALGTAVFLIVFSLLQGRQMRYLRQIVNAMRDISAGDFDRTVPVEGDNELSEIALLLNRTRRRCAASLPRGMPRSRQKMT